MFCSAISIVSHFSRLLSNFWRTCYIIDPYGLLQLAYYTLSDRLSDPWIGWVLPPPRNCSCCSLCLGCFPTLRKAGCFSSLGLQLKCPLLRSLSWWLILGISWSLTLRYIIVFISCCLVSKSCLTLCDPMDCSTPGFPVLHYLPEFAPTLVHWVSDAV